MPIDLSKTLVIGISSRALFDLDESNRVFEADGLAAYTAHQIRHTEYGTRSVPTTFRAVNGYLAANRSGGRSQDADVSIAAGPYGEATWTEQAAAQLGLQSTLRRRGRPHKA